MSSDPTLAAGDPAVYELCRSEERRQGEKIRLIPSENYTSRAVLEASGSVFANKYSEGYPQKRYYEGQQFTDPLEELAIKRAKDLFGAQHDGTDHHRRPFRIIHRDISPYNLVVSFSGQTKIIDFGIAREGDAPEPESGARPGKVSYMSPEQVQGSKLDGRSDIFSLGTILYEITLGKRLWRGAKEVVMRRIVDEQPPPPTYVNRAYPPALELIVLRALEKRPENRYPTAGELFEDLEAYLVASGARTR